MEGESRVGCRDRENAVFLRVVDTPRRRGRESCVVKGRSLEMGWMLS